MWAIRHIVWISHTVVFYFLTSPIKCRGNDFWYLKKPLKSWITSASKGVETLTFMENILIDSRVTSDPRCWYLFSVLQSWISAAVYDFNSTPNCLAKKNRCDRKKYRSIYVVYELHTPLNHKPIISLYGQMLTQLPLLTPYYYYIFFIVTMYTSKITLRPLLKTNLFVSVYFRCCLSDRPKSRFT